MLAGPETMVKLGERPDDAVPLKVSGVKVNACVAGTAKLRFWIALATVNERVDDAEL
jgi:hypothetical protein